MPALDNPRHEKFAQALASGMDEAKAYESIGHRNAKRKSVYESACRLSRLVKNRVKEIQAESNTANTLTMRERREFIARVVRVKLHELDLSEDGDLIQEITRTEGSEGKAGVEKVKLPGKLDSIMADAKLAGELVEKRDLTTDGQALPPINFVLPKSFVQRRGQTLHGKQ